MTKNIIDTLHVVSTDNCGDPQYRLDEIEQNVKLLVKIDDLHWLALNSEDELSEGWLNFAFFEFSKSDLQGANTLVGIVFIGEGPTGALREMRHIWWGPNQNGYTFYLSTKSVIKALEYLQKYYD